MKLIIYDPSVQIRKLMVQTLIQNAVVAVEVREKLDIIPRLSSDPFDMLILGIGEKDRDLIRMIDSIKKDERLRKIHIIAYIDTPSREFPAALLKKGVCGFIAKPFVPERFIDRYNRIVAKVNPNGLNRRQHLRVVIRKEDKVVIRYRIPGNFKITQGKVINLSMSGALFQMLDPYRKMEIGHGLKNLQINLTQSKVKADAVVVAQKDRFIAIKFNPLTEFEKNLLSRYILSYIAEKEEMPPTPYA